MPKRKPVGQRRKKRTVEGRANLRRWNRGSESPAATPVQRVYPARRTVVQHSPLLRQNLSEQFGTATIRDDGSTISSLTGGSAGCWSQPPARSSAEFGQLRSKLETMLDQLVDGVDLRSAGKSSSTTSKTSEMKFTPQINGQSVGASYATIKESICHKIQKTPSQFPDGFDLAQSLRNGELVNLKKEKPTRALATHKDPEAKKVLQDGLDIEYKIVFDKWHNRCANLEANQTTAYSMIFDQYCTRAMQARIEEHPDFSTKIVNKPIQLLETIKTCIQQTVRAQYPLVSATESLKVFLNMRQRDDEELLDYVKRFKQQRDIVKSQMGTKILDHFVTTTEEYSNADTAEQKELVESSFERWTAYLLLKSVDRNKYGGLQTQIA